MQTKKGFTLIELLIVIGIIAILATAVLLVINPAQILSETRDTQRLSDLDTVKAALNLMVYNAASAVTFVTGPGCSVTVTNVQSPFTSPAACTAPSSANLRTILGSGWVPMNFGTNPAITVLPIDPTQTAVYAYHYKGSNTVNGTFELDAKLESTKHRDKMINDGGDQNACITYVEQGCWYEVGTSLTL